MIFAALRSLCAACGAAAVVGLGAWAGGALHPARAQSGRPGRATFELAYRHDRGEIPVGDSLEVNGQPMQLSVFYTPDRPRRVAAFYADAFHARGVMPVAALEDDLAHVSGFDPRDGLQRFISALRQPDGQTLVIVGVSDPRRPPRLTARPADGGIPVPVEHRGYLSFRSTDQGASADTGQYVSSLPVADVLAFYRRELAAGGFSERPQEGSASLAVFAKRGGLISVAVQALGDDRGSAVFVSSTSGDPR